MQYLKKKPETAVLLLLLGLVVLAGIALAVLTASNRKAEQAASEAAIRVVAVTPAIHVRRFIICSYCFSILYSISHRCRYPHTVVYRQDDI